MYEHKIKESIYSVTGREDTDPAVVTFVQGEIYAYLLSLKENVQGQYETRLKRKDRRTKLLHVDDLYAVLHGTLEYHGVKRCVLLKQLTRKVEDTDDASDLAVDNPVSEIDAALKRENSASFQAFEESRMQDLIDADELTKRMSLEEYLAYSKKAKTAFVERPKLFCEWLQWNPRPNRIILIAFGWLATHRIKQLVRAASARQQQEGDSLKVEHFTAPGALTQPE